jgi:DNA-binding transcriptional ArsR family regulator
MHSYIANASAPCAKIRETFMAKPIELSDEALEQIAARFRVLGEPSRLRLLRELRAGPRSVGELVDATGLTQANASRHLQNLRDAGILGRRKEGLSVIYHIADPGVLDLCHLVCGGIRRTLEKRARAMPASR